MMRGPEGTLPEDPFDEERVPVFRTWPRIYAAVLLNALVIMVLVYVFSRWPY
jgi:hypothetical protein